MIDQLITSTGDFRSILGLKETTALVDLSDDHWDSRFEVVRGITFNRAMLSGKTIAVNFVECQFHDCEFSHLRSDGHFSGAGNTWRRCRFSDLQLRDLIAPQSRFSECEFRNVTIQGFRLCQTAFENCVFDHLTVEGLVSRSPGDRAFNLEDVAKTGANALFSSCSFANSRFNGCSFSDVCFIKCNTDRTEFENCDFAGVLGTDSWWRKFRSGDPHIAFLDAVLQAVERRVGKDSRAYSALSAYVQSYTRGDTKSKDYSACLYSGNVPDDELDALQESLEAVEAAYPQ